MREAWVAITILGVGAGVMTLTRPQGAYVIPVLFGLDSRRAAALCINIKERSKIDLRAGAP
jgi:hypothetical protein